MPIVAGYAACTLAALPFDSSVGGTGAVGRGALVTGFGVVEIGAEDEVNGEIEGPDVRFSGAPDSVIAVGDPEVSPSALPEVDQDTEGPEVLVAKPGVTPSQASQ